MMHLNVSRKYCGMSMYYQPGVENRTPPPKSSLLERQAFPLGPSLGEALGAVGLALEAHIAPIGAAGNPFLRRQATHQS